MQIIIFQPRMKIILYLFFVACACCFFGCSERPALGTLTAYLEKHGVPDIVAQNINIETKGNGLRVAIVEGPVDRITNSRNVQNFVSGSLLFANSSELKWSADNYYLERKNTNFAGGMYHPTRSWFGERVTIVKVDSEGKIQSVVNFKVDAVSIRDRILVEPR